MTPQRPDLNHTPQLNPTTTDGAPSQTKPQRLWSKDRHLQLKEATAVYSVKRHFLSVGLEILIGTTGTATTST